MKTLKKVCASVVALLLVLTMGITALADETAYTIKITNTKKDQTYTAYKLFDVESYSGDETADPSTAKAIYKIKTADAFYDFVATGDGADYVTLTQSNKTGEEDVYYVTWKDGVDEDTAADFAKAALSYAKENNVQSAASDTASADDEEVTLTVTESGAGYYLVDTSLGALASLDTTNPTAEIEEKNDVPTVEKSVLEDSTNDYGENNTAEIGDTVTFVTKISVAKTPTGYVLYDKMDAGFTYGSDVKVYSDEECTTEIETKYYSVATSGVKYQPAGASASEEGSFSVTFDDTLWDTLTYDGNGASAVYVKYTAVLNENASVSYDSAVANQNSTYLTYGDNNTATSAESITNTYTYAFDLVKTDEENTLIDGASFTLGELEFVKTADNAYRVATDEEIADDQTETTDTIVVKGGGPAKISGLDADSYSLVEVDVPQGYNRAADSTVALTAADDYTATVNGNALKATVSSDTYTSGGVQVINKQGSLLPGTGGIGTTIFYIAGGCLVAIAVIFFITKKRMSA